MCQHSSSVKPLWPVLAFALVATLVVSIAPAHGSDSYEPPYRIDYRPEDQARARAVVLRPSDLPANRLWSDDGVRRPTIFPPLGCPSSPSSRPFPVLTGAAEHVWEAGGSPLGFTLDSQARVLGSSRMVSRETRPLRSPDEVVRCWRASRRAHAPKLSRCAPRETCTTADRSISFGRIAFPRVAPLTFALQSVDHYRQQRGSRVVEGFRTVTKYVVLAQGRTEIVLTASGPPQAVGGGLVVRLVRALAARVTA